MGAKNKNERGREKIKEIPKRKEKKKETVAKKRKNYSEVRRDMPRSKGLQLKYSVGKTERQDKKIVSNVARTLHRMTREVCVSYFSPLPY
jgi:hypothetical protein